jgi:hypothetical protein
MPDNQSFENEGRWYLCKTDSQLDSNLISYKAVAYSSVGPVHTKGPLLINLIIYKRWHRRDCRVISRHLLLVGCGIGPTRPGGNWKNLNLGVSSGIVELRNQTSSAHGRQYVLSCQTGFQECYQLMGRTSNPDIVTKDVETTTKLLQICKIGMNIAHQNSEVHISEVGAMVWDYHFRLSPQSSRNWRITDMIRTEYSRVSWAEGHLGH